MSRDCEKSTTEQWAGHKIRKYGPKYVDQELVRGLLLSYKTAGCGHPKENEHEQI